MSSRQIVTITCDWCDQIGAEEEFATTTTTVKVNGDTPRQVDLCEEHSEILETLRGVLRTRGVRPDLDPVQGLVRCEICGQPCKGGTGLAAHQRHRHGTEAAA